MVFDDKSARIEFDLLALSLEDVAQRHPIHWSCMADDVLPGCGYNCPVHMESILRKLSAFEKDFGDDKMW
jgi:hypothetical protein